MSLWGGVVITELLVVLSIGLLILFFCFSLLKAQFNSRTPKLIAIAICHFTILAFKVDGVFQAVNEFFLINHVAWLLIVLSAYMAFLLTNSFFNEIGQSFPHKHFTLVTTLALFATLLSFAFVSTSPENINGQIANTVSQRIYMLIYYSYSMYLSVGLSISGLKLKNKENVSYKRARWWSVIIALYVYSLYYASRLTYISIDHVFGAQSSFLQAIANFSLVATIFIVLFIFMPAWFYKKIVSIGIYIKKTQTLYNLSSLNSKIIKSAGNNEIANLSIRDFFNLDYLIHSKIVSILDYKFYQKNGHQKDDLQINSELMPLYSKMMVIDDDQDYEQLVKNYSQLGKLVRLSSSTLGLIKKRAATMERAKAAATGSKKQS